MGKQLALGGVLGSIVLFVWSAIAWMLISLAGRAVTQFHKRGGGGPGDYGERSAFRQLSSA